MLTGIGLRNFKAFGDEMQEAPLSKITLIYGPNSGGKSSIIQALLLLKQSLKSRYDVHTDARSLEANGELVDLGDSESLLHRHENERHLGIRIKYKNLIEDYGSAENLVCMTYVDNVGQKDSVNLEAVSYKITPNGNDTPLLDAVSNPADASTPPLWWNTTLRIAEVCADTYSHLQTNRFLPCLPLYGLEDQRNQKHTLSPTLERHLSRVRGRARQLALSRELALEPELLTRTQELVGGSEPESNERQELINELELGAQAREPADMRSLILQPQELVVLTPEDIPDDYERHLHSINYLGPLRRPPEKVYRLLSTSDSIVGVTGIQGEFTPSVLHNNPVIEEQVNDWFAQFEIPYTLAIRRLIDDVLPGSYIVIALTDKRTNTQLTVADVGFGISCILPVIVEGIASQESATICVEQPEIHLHPSLQANIADLMIDTIADEPGKRKQWIVETHSELLITRLQRRVREGGIRSEDVTVLYVDPDNEYSEGSAIIKLRLDENGDFIDHWPHGFFDEAFNELMAEPGDGSIHLTNPAKKNNGIATSTQSDELLDD